jgi:hypothetical protein
LLTSSSHYIAAISPFLCAPNNFSGGASSGRPLLALYPCSLTHPAR